MTDKTEEEKKTWEL